MAAATVPVGALTSAVGPKSVTVNWSSGTPISLGGTGFNDVGAHFIVQASSVSGFATITASTVSYNDASGMVTSLTAGTSYYFRVQAYNTANITDYSWCVLGSTLTTSGQPTPVSVAAVYIASITVSYTKVGADSYLVQASTSIDFTTVFSSAGVSDSSLSLTGLSTNTLYYLQAGALWGPTTYYAASLSTYTLVETPTGIAYDDISTFSITASGYAATPAFSNLSAGVSGVNVAQGPGYNYGPWRNGNVWNARAALPTPRIVPAAVASAGKLYAMGGFNGSGFYNQNEEYDPAADAWSTRAPLPTARFLSLNAGAAGRIYVMGGIQSGGPANANEEYDPAANTWNTRTAMPTARSDNGAAATVSGKVYSMGNGATEEYDPAANTWNSRAARPDSNDKFAAAAVGGRIYSVGGGSAGNANWEYDPAANVWNTRAPMPMADDKIGAAGMGGKLYAVGGDNTCANCNYSDTGPY